MRDMHIDIIKVLLKKLGGKAAISAMEVFNARDVQLVRAPLSNMDAFELLLIDPTVVDVEIVSVETLQIENRRES